MIAALIQSVGVSEHDDIRVWLADALSVVSRADQTSYADAARDRRSIERLLVYRGWERELRSHPSVRRIRSRDWRNIPDADRVMIPDHPQALALSRVADEAMRLLESAGDKWSDRELLNYVADGAWLAMRLVGLRAGIGETYHG